MRQARAFNFRNTVWFPRNSTLRVREAVTKTNSYINPTSNVKCKNGSNGVIKTLNIYSQKYFFFLVLMLRRLNIGNIGLTQLIQEINNFSHININVQTQHSWYNRLIACCHPQIHMLKANPQGDGVRRWASER